MKERKFVIADNLKESRKEHGITQTELAEKAELSLDSIRRIEAGSRSMSLETFLRLADALGEAPGSLLCENRIEEGCVERFENLIAGHSEPEVQFVLSMAEHLLKDAERYLSRSLPAA